MTGRALGEALGRSASQVAEIEDDTRKLDVGELAVVADILRVTLPELLGVRHDGPRALAIRLMSTPGGDKTATSVVSDDVADL